MNTTSMVTGRGTRPGEAAPAMRVAVYCPRPVPSLIRSLGTSVRVRMVHRPQEVRASDDLVVVVAGAGTFLRGLTEALGRLTPPVLVVGRPEEAKPGPRAYAEPLTPRECDIMTLLAAGRSIREIAEALAIGGKTVRNNLSNIYRKLGVRRQTEALIHWLSAGDPIITRLSP
jgi:DNA-binding CsgD family transcriptional regulator